MFYNGYYFWGMHWVWWIIWIILIFWIFALPYRIPGERMKRESPLDILKRRFANGELSAEEYQERKKFLENEMKK